VPPIDDLTAAGRPPSLSGFASYLSAQVAKGASRALGERLAVHGVRTHHLAVLAALADHGPSCQQDLCDRLDLDKSHMVGFVDDLEAGGHVVRARDPQDRRRHSVDITASGRDLLARLLAEDEVCQTDVFGVLSAEERDLLVALLQRVVAGLDAQRLGQAPAPAEEVGR
jgi:MarR family transcriptional regulator, lower aerobic nicotinate degradation pathway regulator